MHIFRFQHYRRWTMETGKALFETIVNDVRDKAQTSAVMMKTGGSVKVSVTPKTKDADDFFGGKGKFNRRTTVGVACINLPDEPFIYEETHNLFPGTKDVAKSPKFVPRTIGLTVQKKIQLNPGDDSIGKVMQTLEWARIEVSVFGAANKSDESYACASVATWSIKKFFDQLDESFAIKGPDVG